MSNYHTWMQRYDSQEHIVIIHLYEMNDFIHYMYIEMRFIKYIQSLNAYFTHYIICDKDNKNI